MKTDLKDVQHHMLGLALGALAHANWHAGFHSWDNEYWAELSILQAAHAAEILIKARISQEHPLLIFEQTPRSNQVDQPLLSLQDFVRTRPDLPVRGTARPTLGCHRHPFTER
jgi:hypothetical protein